MTPTQPLSPARRVTAWTVDALCLLTGLLCRLAPMGGRLLWPQVPVLLWLVVGAGLQGLLLSPLRLGRVRWYCRPAASLRPLGRGWKFAGAAIAWRWQRWLRRTLMWAVLLLPASVCWSLGALETRSEVGVLWWLVGGGCLLLAGLVFLVWQCRYAMAPLFLLEGYPASAALSLSARAMRGGAGDWLRFWWEQGRRALLSLLPPFSLWHFPRLRLEYTRFLLRRRRHSQPAPRGDALAFF